VDLLLQLVNCGQHVELDLRLAEERRHGPEVDQVARHGLLRVGVLHLRREGRREGALR
jgi:hypothetical protein